MTKLPKCKLKVGGREYNIVSGRRSLEGASGVFRPDEYEIEIARGEELIDVLLHEFVHSIQYFLGTYCLSRQDEGNEDKIASIIRMILKDNGKLVKWLVDNV